MFDELTDGAIEIVAMMTIKNIAKVICMECIHLNSHGEAGAKMARLGFGGCTKQPGYTFPSMTRERQCAWFVRADDARIARVKAYAAKGKA